MTPQATTSLPETFDVEVDADTIEATEQTLLGGSPFRVLRLSSPGAIAWRQIRDGDRPLTLPARVLAQTLISNGMAHPVPGEVDVRRDVTVVVPVLDRTAELDRCLRALDSTYPTIVVDDGSVNPGAIADICATHNVQLIRRKQNGGPAAARNCALAHVDSEFIAFIDSDCVATSGWIDALCAHFDDPSVAAVAPRVIAEHGGSGVLDLGDRPGRVAALTRIGHVPTAALLVRRRCLDAVSVDGAAFDPELRVGEDVDLVWRLADAGWSVRYDPTVLVNHDEPHEIASVMARRFQYGTSAAPLSKRHPGKVLHFLGLPWPTATCLFAWAVAPRLFVAALLATIARTHSSLAPTAAARSLRTRFALRSIWQTWLGLSRYVTQFFAPFAIVMMLVSSRRAMTVALVATAPLAHDRNQPLHHLAGDVAYGSGVWKSALDHRDLTPVIPRRWKPPPPSSAASERNPFAKPKGRP